MSEGEATVPRRARSEPVDRGHVLLPENEFGFGEEQHGQTLRRRLTTKTAIKALKPLSDPEEEAEILAELLSKDEVYTFEALQNLFDKLEKVRQIYSRAARRQPGPRTTAWFTGMFTRGGIAGLRTGSKRMPWTTRYLVKFAQNKFGIKEFAAIGLAKDSALNCHRDLRNQCGTLNTVSAITSFQGGGVWYEDENGTVSREVKPGVFVKGHLQELKQGETVSFAPEKWHEAQPHKGERLVLVTYCPRLQNLLEEDRRTLTTLGFVLPESSTSLPSTPEQGPQVSGQRVVKHFADDDEEEEVAFHLLRPSFEQETSAFVCGADPEALQEQLEGIADDQAQLLEDLQERGERLCFLLEEEASLVEDIARAGDEVRAGAERVDQVVAGLVEKIAELSRKGDDQQLGACLKAAAVGEEPLYESLLEALNGEDLKVVHNVPMNQVRQSLEKWKGSFAKELGTLFDGGTLRRMSMSEAKRLEREGLLRLVKGVATLKPPTTKGDGFRRKFRLVLCGNFAEAEPSYGSLCAGGASVESFRTALTLAAALRWFGASTDITAAFLLAEWPANLSRYAVVPPKFLVEAGFADPSEV